MSSKMSNDPVKPATPIQRGFEYEVRLAVSIPLTWALLLKTASKHHYDARCHTAGDHGVINGLYNTALDSEWPSTYPVTWSDLDLTTKVAEQLEYHTFDHALVRAIRAWLRETMDAITRQGHACMGLPGSNGPDDEELTDDSPNEPPSVPTHAEAVERQRASVHAIASPSDLEHMASGKGGGTRAMSDGRKPDPIDEAPRCLAYIEADFESLRRGGSCRTAVCRCGWKGPQRGSLELAADDALLHERSDMHLVLGVST